MEQQTPGVYINEINAFPNSVVEVATAVPVFIGYTAQASYNGEDLANKPQRVTSLKEFVTYFGYGATTVFDLNEVPAGTDVATLGAELAVRPVVMQINKLENYNPDTTTLAKYALTPASDIYYLYNSVRLFYQNGGATCYIISIGAYTEAVPNGTQNQETDTVGGTANAADTTDGKTKKDTGTDTGDQKATPPKSEKDKFMDAINSLIYEQEPTMLVCPDALRLAKDEYYDVAKAMLGHCNATQSRVALLDVYNGAVTSPLTLNQAENPVTDFRNGVSTNYLKYGVGYFPWVQTTVVGNIETSFLNLTPALLKKFSDAAAAAVEAVAKAVEAAADKPAEKAVAVARQRFIKDYAGVVERVGALAKTAPESRDTAFVLDVIREHNALMASNRDYSRLIDNITRYQNTLPVAAAMAGVYTAVDTNRGVWKAPANVGLNGVVAPTVNLSDNDQARLNVDAATGKSLNAIRPFPGQGVLVWGARTLDGNSQDWKYVNVRRTMIMLEQSIKLAARAYVFEPNDANTWVTVQSMINNFLFNLWKQGALAGSKPDDAYSVAVGLGTTMTADDILNGYMNVFVKVAISRPAEFIVLSFQQQMQKS
ncbi:phage tail sheath family protein [Hymenobacter elongatus]|uniref:Phage tail sheath family protein n=1 Tax=Hymenobacter elongatus TaxID=877208 RepID=A0A4Z0PGS2_9BACT|nr:phage tail sheath C-terminal domain-containing protein [Hymenobacter elongatus]TGE14014.1 phage tail sheath family protein [Hymenobacter elongatus]